MRLADIVAFGTGAMQGYEREEDRALKKKKEKLLEDAAQFKLDQSKLQAKTDEEGAKGLASIISGLPAGANTGNPGVQPQSIGPSQQPQGMMPAFQVQDMIRREAINRGIDPQVALRVAQSEGLKQYTGDQGSSFGPFQLHYGGMAPGGNRVSGLGDVFTKQTGLDARDPRTIPQQIQFALDQAKQGGWGPWHGAARAGIAPQQGIGGSAQPGAPQQPGAASPQQPQGGGMDWRAAAKMIMQKNPGMSPMGLMSALNQLQPFLNMESKQQLADMKMQLAEQKLQQAQQLAIMGDATKRRGQDIGLEKSEKAEEGRNMRFQAREKGISERSKARLDLLERKFEYARTKDEKMAALREMEDAERSRRATVRAIIAASTGMAGDERKKMIEQESSAMREADQRIDRLKLKMREQDTGAPQGQRVQEPSAPAVPKAGDVQDGYRFKGGDPGDPKSWEKV